jgi:Arc/MetJ-type ribon-helix-helix transcriptional regulator
MSLEIHKRELVQRVNAQIRSGHFHDVDDLIEKALDALDERTPGALAATDRRGGAGGITGLAISGHRSHAAPRAPYQCAGCCALMAWLLDTNILSKDGSQSRSRE